MMAAEHPEHLSLVLIRHGQTAYNLSGKIQGSMDIPLNERGREQARGLRDAVTHLLAVSPVPVKVFASPLSRAYETAAIAL
ncbi:MAG: histidine phosphatase family protein, partial [Anaerolineaceae bacterium]|nr:histidine phosphatase family protein [Anaerolineaceae bacterium]